MALNSSKAKKQSGTRACAVSTCYNPLGVSYHRFPKDPQIRKEWIHRCKRKEQLNPNTSRICERHFNSNDFERDLKNELLGLPQVKRLKKSVLPTLNIPIRVLNPDPSTAKSEEKRENKTLLEGILGKSRFENVDNLSKNTKQSAEDVSTQSKSKQSSDTKEALYWKQKFRRLESCHKKLKNSYNLLRVELRNAKKNIRKLNSKTFQNDKMGEFLRNHRSNSKGAKFCQSYDRDDVTVALVLRSISCRAFEYLRTKNALPLPSKRTLDRWLADFRVEPGLQIDNIIFLQEMCHAATDDAEKMAVICFGEMLIKKRDECDKSLKKVIGPSKKCLVVMVRGLIKDWKQPIYYEFNKSMDKDLLYLIISKLEEAGVKVLAVSFDLENTVQLDKELEICSSNVNSFSNPADVSREIYLFPDAPHLMKSIRNHLLDNGLQLPDGDGNYASLDKEDLRDIIDRGHKESKTHHKLTMEHLTICGSGRRQVRMACQLFSRTTAYAFTYFYGQNKSIQSDAISIINDWFDCMNGHDANLLKCGFGQHFHEQETALNKMKHLIAGMNNNEVTSSMLPWQKGILVSIQSTISLYHYLQTQGVQYLPTERLNKDVLEDFFSRIRALGGDHTSHPSSSEFVQRFKILLIERNPDLLIKNSGVKLKGSSIEEQSFQSPIMVQDIMESINKEDDTDMEESSLLGSEKNVHS